MQVAKWGNSLAVRLPAAVVEALELKEGDQIEIRVASARSFEVGRDKVGSVPWLACASWAALYRPGLSSTAKKRMNDER